MKSPHPNVHICKKKPKNNHARKVHKRMKKLLKKLKKKEKRRKNRRKKTRHLKGK